MKNMKAAKIVALAILAAFALATCDSDPSTSLFCAEKFCEPAGLKT
jgi:hypothetical protein